MKKNKIKTIEEFYNLKREFWPYFISFLEKEYALFQKDLEVVEKKIEMQIFRQRNIDQQVGAAYILNENLRQFFKDIKVINEIALKKHDTIEAYSMYKLSRPKTDLEQLNDASMRSSIKYFKFRFPFSLSILYDEKYAGLHDDFGIMISNDSSMDGCKIGDTFTNDLSNSKNEKNPQEIFDTKVIGWIV